jgi:hypothetical protein
MKPMSELPFNLFDLEPEENRSVIADNVDLLSIKTRDMRDTELLILAKLSPPSAETKPPPGND